ncbi:MAG: peptidoglycan-binding protein [Pseudomonadota bacterium]
MRTRFAIVIGLTGWLIGQSALAHGGPPISRLLEGAERGSASAQRELGQRYLMGRGVHPNPFEAYVWFSIASAHGDYDVERDQDIAGRQLSPRQRARADRYAQWWVSEHTSVSHNAWRHREPVIERQMYTEAAPSAELVADVQSMLVDLGYSPGPVDGILGPRTLNAIRAYQQTNRLVPDGRATYPLAAHMRARRQTSPEIETYPGDQDVAMVQKALTLLGYDPGPIDGRSGRQTVAAINTFQRREGMRIGDGISVALMDRLRARLVERTESQLAYQR